MKRGYVILAPVLLLGLAISLPLSGISVARVLAGKVSSPIDDRSVQAVFVDGGTVYAGTYLGAGVYRSTDNGDSWSGHGTGLPTGTYMPDVMAIVRRGSDILAGTWGEGVYKTAASGDANWSSLSSGLASGYKSIRAMAIQTGTSPSTYVADPDRVVYHLAWGSSQWQQLLSTGLPTPSDENTTEYDITCLFLDGTTLYAGLMDTGVYSYTTGSGWTQTGTLGRSALAMDYGTDGNLWVGTSDGVYRWVSGDWELVWGAENEITALKRNPFHPSELFVGLSTGAVHRYQQSTGWSEVTGLGIDQRVWSLAFGTPDMADLTLSLSNDPDASVSLSAEDIITYTMDYENSGGPLRLFVGAADGLYYTDTLLLSMLLKCDIPESGVVGWDPVAWEETHESTHQWIVTDVVAAGAEEHDFWVAVGPPPATIPAPPGAMLVINEGTYGTVSGTPVPSSAPVYNWIGTPHRIYLPLVMKNHG